MGRKVNREYQLNQNELDRQRIPVICIDCGIEYTLSKAYIRQHKDAPRRCKECGKKHAAAKISENYKNMTEEEKLNKTKGIRNYYKSLTPEEREAYMKPLYKGRDKYFSTRSDEEKERMALEISNRNKKYHASLSEEEKQQYRQVRKDAYDNFSQEKKDEFRIRSEKQWEGLSPEEIEERMQPLRKGYREWFDNMTEEEKEHRRQIMKDHWKYIREKNGSSDKSCLKTRSKESPNITKTESEFMNHLNINNIKYEFQYLSKDKHPEFDKYFPAKNGNSISPYHSWDFMIHLRNKDILVDVDGSIHANLDTKINNFNAFIKSYDSRRPYQTDGLDAYIIKAYNNKVEDNTIVSNLKTNEEIKFKDFLNTLILDSMPEDDVKDLIKLSLK